MAAGASSHARNGNVVWSGKHILGNGDRQSVPWHRGQERLSVIENSESTRKIHRFTDNSGAGGGFAPAIRVTICGSEKTRAFAQRGIAATKQKRTAEPPRAQRIWTPIDADQAGYAPAALTCRRACVPIGLLCGLCASAVKGPLPAARNPRICSTGPSPQTSILHVG
jgi:hypothetical protein